MIDIYMRTVLETAGNPAARRPVVVDLPDPAPLGVIPDLPVKGWPPQGGGDVLSRLEGGTIVRIGAPEDDTGLEGGGFVIDYLPPGSDETWRLVLAFNGFGMSIAWHGSLAGVTPSTDIMDW